MALNCNKEIPGVTDYEGTVGVPAGQCYHCHTGRCPVGITTQDPELRKRLVVEDAAMRVYNFLTTLTMELQMLARACGKTNVHSLEPEDLAALTVEAAACAKVPLAGTSYIPGETEHEILAEVRKLLAQKARRRSRLHRRAAGRSSRPGGGEVAEMSEQHHHHDIAYAEPEKIKSIDAEFLSGKRFEYQEDISLLDDVDLLALTPGEDINWLEDVGAPRGGRRPRRLRSVLELVHQDLLPDPRGAGGRAGPQGADEAPRLGQLLRDPAEGRPLQVPPARARLVGRGLEDGRHRLAAARARRLGTPRRALIAG